MKVLALDLSTKSAGWAYFDGQKLIDYGCIVTTNSNVLTRISTIVEQLEIVYQRYFPQEIIVEEVLPEDVGHNNTVFKALMYLQGVVAVMFNKYGKKLEFFTASEWRKKCGIRTGRGIKRDTLKAADMKFVEDHYKIVANDDICDAICIGYAYTHKTVITEDGFEFK